mmetsp:Transcript_11070/g.21139  ORF Transcript_11070/g.21139 Transcript_11070/m.21139 type:complete len:305 (+) Transcript_11070:224-1138(+)
MRRVARGVAVGVGAPVMGAGRRRDALRGIRRVAEARCAVGTVRAGRPFRHLALLSRHGGGVVDAGGARLTLLVDVALLAGGEGVGLDGRWISVGGLGEVGAGKARDDARAGSVVAAVDGDDAVGEAQVAPVPTFDVVVAVVPVEPDDVVGKAHVPDADGDCGARLQLGLDGDGHRLARLFVQIELAAVALLADGVEDFGVGLHGHVLVARLGLHVAGSVDGRLLGEDGGRPGRGEVGQGQDDREDRQADQDLLHVEHLLLHGHLLLDDLVHLLVREEATARLVHVAHGLLGRVELAVAVDVILL